MSSTVIRSRSAGVSGHLLVALVALAVALSLALVIAPRTLAASGSADFSDENALRDAFRKAFAEYWASGSGDFPASLQHTVDYWFRYHIAKAVIAGLLLIVLVALAVLLWKAFLRAAELGAGISAALATAGTFVTLLALFALLTVMANLQGVAAPFASLLPMLPVGDSGGDLAPTLHQIRQDLAEDRITPALRVMIDDFGRYHAAMAVIAATTGVIAIVASALCWRAFARTTGSDKRTRRTLAAFATLATVLSLAAITIAVVNTATAADSPPALTAFFDGGW
ncbi:hypothetical protein AB0L82_30905 [Nocardia sp. NPDC052001]|uniref:hypothetical protein n=1 Tax=Nocardia sp. NPDC052001 TaxID=3154853 RepID=UPI00343E6921